MPMSFVHFGWTCKLMMPSAVEMSVAEDVPFRSSTPLCAFVYNAPVLALARDDLTALMMEASL